MSSTMLRVAVCIALLTGVLGLPFATEEEANQFLGLKRQTPSSKYWYPAIRNDAFDLSILEKVKESWDALKKSAQHYWNLGFSEAKVNNDRNQPTSYVDMFHESGEHLERQRRKRNSDVIIHETDIAP